MLAGKHYFGHTPIMVKSLKDYAAEFSRKGGKARAKALTKEERKAIAQKAAKARWSKKNKGQR